MSIVRYAAVLQAQPEGGFTVIFPDIPEAITEGDSREEALFHAAVAVRTARQAQGLTLSDLARSLETSWAAAQKLESPRANPTLKQLDRAARVLGKRLVLSLE